MDKFIILPIAIFIITVIVVLKSRASGKEKIDKYHIQITPPNDLNPLELAYVYKGKVELSDVLSLITYLGDKGFIKFEFPFNYDMSQINDFKMIKKKEYDGNNILEGFLLKELFKEKDIITYNELCNDSKIKRVFQTCEKIMESDRSYNIIFNENRKKTKRVINIVTFIMIIISNIAYSSKLITRDIDLVVIMIPIILIISILQIAIMFFISSSKNGTDMMVQANNGPKRLSRNKTSNIMLFALILLFFSGMLVFIVQYMGGQLDIKDILFYLASILILALAQFIQNYIGGRNKEGEELYQKTLKFREFLQITPREGIEEEFNKNKDCYFDIFSYCYTLDMSEKCTSEYDKFFNNVCRILYETIPQTVSTEMQDNINNQQQFDELKMNIENMLKEREIINNQFREDLSYIINNHQDKLLNKTISYREIDNCIK